MAKPNASTIKKGSSRKCGRQRKKNLRRGSAISLYVRGLISFDSYQKQMGK